METRRLFVDNFPTPMMVIHKDSMQGLGVCQGVRNFDNGWFAARHDGSVTLYDARGKKREEQLDDVYVFQCNAVLKKPKHSSLWLFCAPSGEIIVQALAAKVLDDKLAALNTGGGIWSIYRLPKRMFTCNKCVRIAADNLDIYPDKQSGYAIFALTSDEKTTLQSRSPVLGDVAAQLDGAAFYLRMPDGSFAVSAAPFKVCAYKHDCLQAETGLGATANLYGARLKLTAKGVYGITSFANGMYLLKRADGSWQLYANNGIELYSGIYDLYQYGDKENDMPSLFFGSGANDEHVVLLLRSDGWLQLTFGQEKKLITPDGICFDNAESPNGVFIF